MASDEHEFNATRIFGFLFLYTALEVAWGMFYEGPRWALWGGLLLFAYLKGYLIFTWFMHMKFEGWIVKGLMLPTVPLVAIVIFANMPDTSFNDDMLYPIGSQLEVELVEVGERVAKDEEGNDILDAQGNPVMVSQKRLVSTGKVTTMADKTAPKAITKAQQDALGGH